MLTRLHSLFLLILGFLSAIGCSLAADPEPKQDYFIKTLDEKYLYFTPDGKLELGKFPQLSSFRFVRVDDGFGIQGVANGRFLTANKDRRVTHAKAMSAWENFQIVAAENKFCFQSSAHKFWLSADLRSDKTTFVDACSNWEQFELHPVQTELLKIRTGDKIAYDVKSSLESSTLRWQAATVEDRIEIERQASLSDKTIFSVKASKAGVFRTFVFQDLGSSTPFKIIEVHVSAGEAASPEKTIWTFWHDPKKIPAFNRFLVESWQKIAGQNWTVRIMQTVDKDAANYLYNFIESSELPATFELLDPKLQSDHVRIALLKKHGGIWMDSSIILMKNLDEFVWDELANEASPYTMGGFFFPKKGTQKYDGKDYFENWFIATRKDNPFMKQWHKVFRQYWNDRTETGDAITEHPLFDHLDLSNFDEENGWNSGNYLTQHVAFRKVIEDYPQFRKFWQTQIQMVDATKTGLFFNMSPRFHNSRHEVAKALFENDEPDLAQELLSKPLIKLTGNTIALLKDKSKEDIQNCKCTLKRMFVALGIFEEF